MEQLLFESDKKEAERYALSASGYQHNNYNDDKTIAGFHSAERAYRSACYDKNSQIQEFDKWKAENGWIRRPHDYINDTTARTISFSELFEIFIKETSK